MQGALSYISGTGSFQIGDALRKMFNFIQWYNWNGYAVLVSRLGRLAAALNLVQTSLSVL
jgi:hypothetical protein